MRRIREHLTYANVMATIAVFLVLGGGSAVALSGSNTVQSDDLGPGAQVKAPDVADNAVNGQDIANESLTGADIKNRSGVQTCKPSTVRYGALCVRDTSLLLNWSDASGYCAQIQMRLPSLGEALQLAWNQDLPNVDGSHRFWTQDGYVDPNGSRVVDAVNDAEQPNAATFFATSNLEVLCVAQPSA